MSRVSEISKHPERVAIEVALAAKVPLATIAMRFGLSIHQASRHRGWLKQHRREYFGALRRNIESRPEIRHAIRERHAHASV